MNKNWTPERLLSEYGEVSLEVFDEMVGPVEMYASFLPCPWP